MMNAPQIVMIVLFALRIGVTVAKEGESMGDFSILVSTARVAILAGILHWGGFWNIGG